ncbi:type II toxin-antitoxin system prevent-host-death family antitoxin [Levilactobacillus fujinensis]|uniref:Type II toxin-antitoxin system prevent-host-death family antitoxin n=1 Tax=Levilactobacillus fujinensis TaxID=2486024 RepID=A0ABW1TEG7_9LACO
MAKSNRNGLSLFLGAKNNVVVLSVAKYDTLAETPEISANTYLMAQIRRSEQQFSRGEFKAHELN